MLTLAGKSALITGGSRGIGLAIARRFADEGAHCTLVGRNLEDLKRAALSLPTDSMIARREHDVLNFDVSDPETGWNRVKKLKNVDILVNSAGIAQSTLLYSTDLNTINNLIGTNLMGTIHGCRTVIPKMMRQKSGCIINISSLLAIQGAKGTSIYAASKAGVVGLTRSLASEVARFGIRANVLLPGYIDTDMTKVHMGELASRIPVGRVGHVDEVADAAAFLAKNEYAHNCVLNLDGGLSAS